MQVIFFFSFFLIMCLFSSSGQEKTMDDRNFSEISLVESFLNQNLNQFLVIQRRWSYIHLYTSLSFFSFFLSISLSYCLFFSLSCFLYLSLLLSLSLTLSFSFRGLNSVSLSHSISRFFDFLSLSFFSFSSSLTHYYSLSLTFTISPTLIFNFSLFQLHFLYLFSNSQSLPICCLKKQISHFRNTRS